MSLWNHDEYRISIYCCEPSGAYRDYFSRYEVISSLWMRSLCVDYRRTNGVFKVFCLAVKILRSVLKKHAGVDILDFVMKKEAEALRKKAFDAYIAYAEGVATQFCSYIQSSNKIAWVHRDYATALPDEIASEAKYYESFRKIVCVSSHAAGTFTMCFPDAAFKVETIYNVINADEILKAADEPLPDNFVFGDEEVRLVSIGRVCAVKGFYKIPQIASELRKCISQTFKWYIVGPGPDAEVQIVIDEIAKYGVEGIVCLVGPVMNPYPLLKHASMLVVTSISESYPTVINEAKILDIPVVSCDFPSANEILSQWGIFAPPAELVKNIASSLKQGKYGQYNPNQENQKSLNSIYQLIEK